jgi:hypothetical protein
VPDASDTARGASIGHGTALSGAALATVLTWRYFTYPPGMMHVNHEGASYVLRLVEFADCLRAGTPFPQWAGDFRGGLGEPYFGYYQPGFFYLASAFTPFLSPTAALGAALWVLSLAGFLATAALVRARFGAAAGLLAGSALLLSPYPRVELYVRGDLSEYAGMMMLPAALYVLVSWFESPGSRTWFAVPLASGALVLLHPVVGMVGYAVLALTTIWYAVALRAWRRGAAAAGMLLLGIGMAAFYWLPVALEWSLARGSGIANGIFYYARSFIRASQLLGLNGRPAHIPVSLEPVVPSLALLGTVLVAVRPGEPRAARRRLVALLWVIAAAAVFLMTEASRPVWEAFPLLQILQFPWRLLVVVTVATAILAGCQPVWPRVVAAAGLAGLIWFVLGLKAGPLVPYEPVRTGADIRAVHFAPDMVDEWLPQGARSFRRGPFPREPACTPACEHASVVERGPGWFRVRVTAERGAVVVLPHYYFPVGWRVTLDGAPIEMGKDSDGLMQIVVQPVRDGMLEARFLGTPMRKRGIAVSASVFLLWCGMFAAHTSRRADRA